MADFFREPDAEGEPSAMSAGTDGPEILYTLIDEDGTEQEFELIDVLKDEETGRVFAALQPYVSLADELRLTDPEEEIDLAVMEMTDGKDGEDFLIPIPDETLFNRISELFLERLQEDEDEDE